MRKKIIKLLIVVLTLCFALLIFFVLPQRLVKISKISCRSQFGDCDPMLTEAFSKLSGKSLFETKKLVINILDDKGMSQSYNFQIKLPSTLEVLIVEKKQVFEVTNSERKEFALVDESGNVLSVSSDHLDLPTLVNSKLPEKGENIKGRDMFALELLKDIKSSFNVGEGVAISDSLVIELSPDLKVIFPMEGDREALVGSIVLLYSRIQENNVLECKERECHNDFQGKISSIDLRFKNPVIKFN